MGDYTKARTAGASGDALRVFAEMLMGYGDRKRGRAADASAAERQKSLDQIAAEERAATAAFRARTLAGQEADRNARINQQNVENEMDGYVAPEFRALPSMPKADIAPSVPKLGMAEGAPDLAAMLGQFSKPEAAAPALLGGKPKFELMPEMVLSLGGYDPQKDVGLQRDLTKTAATPRAPIDMRTPEQKAADELEQHKRKRQYDIQNPTRDPNPNSGFKSSLVFTQYNSDPTVKEAGGIATGIAGMKQAVANPSAAGDRALVFSFMKALDPNSTVREGEYASAMAAAGVPAKIVQAATRVQNGEILTPEQRQDFLTVAEARARAHRDQLRAVNKRYGGMFQSGGMDPAGVLFDPYEGVLVDQPTENAPASGKGRPRW